LEIRDAGHRLYCRQRVLDLPVRSSHQEENMSSHLYKNDRADPKLPGYRVLIAPTNCKDCDCAQRLVRCQNAVEQHRTVFV
jgi:hypothetical protein